MTQNLITCVYTVKFIGCVRGGRGDAEYINMCIHCKIYMLRKGVKVYVIIVDVQFSVKGRRWDAENILKCFQWKSKKQRTQYKGGRIIYSHVYAHIYLIDV